MKIFLSSKADKQLAKLPTKMHDLLISHIEKLANNHFPSQSRKLTNITGWRIRVGDYRILYTVEKRKELIILSVAHRKEVYKL